MICESCRSDRCEECTGDMPSPDVECKLIDCGCVHDTATIERRTKTLRLLNQAVERFGSDDEAGMLYAVRRILGIYDEAARTGARLRVVR